MITYLLFDIDNTLYPQSSGLGPEINRLMTTFVANHLNVSARTADRLRRDAVQAYGSTLNWLRSEGNLADVESFLEAVHPPDLTPWISDDHAAETRAVLDAIDLPAAILTNGPREHAERVLDRLGVTDRFDALFDLRSNDFVGKPARRVYTRALETLSIRPDTTLFVDDMLQYLLPFRDLGGNVVHLAMETSSEAAVPTITSLRELLPIIYPDWSRG